MIMIFIKLYINIAGSCTQTHPLLSYESGKEECLLFYKLFSGKVFALNCSSKKVLSDIYRRHIDYIQRNRPCALAHK